MSKLTAEETSELIHKEEESRKLIDELREKLHEAKLAIATEKARADRLEKTAPKKLYPDLSNAAGASNVDDSSRQMSAFPSAPSTTHRCSIWRS
jgi:hypothetical protein